MPALYLLLMHCSLISLALLWLLLMQCSRSALHLTFLPSPPPIPLHFHWLNPTRTSRMTSEDLDIVNCPPRPPIAFPTADVCLDGWMPASLYRMNCVQARSICHIFLSHNSNRSQREGICWIQRFLGGWRERNIYAHLIKSFVFFSPLE